MKAKDSNFTGSNPMNPNIGLQVLKAILFGLFFPSIYLIGKLIMTIM